VLRIGLVAADQESGMKWRVVVELAGADGTVQSHEISVGGCGTCDYAPELRDKKAQSFQASIFGA